MILVDTSVWFRHIRMGDKKLAELLEEGEVSCDPHIIRELACGNLRPRPMVLSLLGELPIVPVAEDEEVLGPWDREKLHGRGFGWIDAHLLASAMLADCRIWTLDVSLKCAAARLRIDFSTTDR